MGHQPSVYSFSLSSSRPEYPAAVFRSTNRSLMSIESQTRKRWSERTEVFKSLRRWRPSNFNTNGNNVWNRPNINRILTVRIIPAYGSSAHGHGHLTKRFGNIRPGFGDFLQKYEVFEWSGWKRTSEKPAPNHIAPVNPVLRWFFWWIASKSYRSVRVYYRLSIHRYER